MTTTTLPVPVTLPATAVLLCGVCRPTWPARWRSGDAGSLVHAVEVHRSSEELDGEPEPALCGTVVAVTGRPWPDTDTCPVRRRSRGQRPGRTANAVVRPRVPAQGRRRHHGRHVSLTR